MINHNNELEHHGVKGMKWGVRFERPATLPKNRNDLAPTRRRKTDYDRMTDSQFHRKHGVTKDKYAKQVKRHGDPQRVANKRRTQKVVATGLVISLMPVTIAAVHDARQLDRLLKGEKTTNSIIKRSFNVNPKTLKEQHAYFEAQLDLVGGRQRRKWR